MAIYSTLPLVYSMGNLISSTIASALLPSLMSATGTIVKGVGTIHGVLTPFVSQVAAKGLWFALLG